VSSPDLNLALMALRTAPELQAPGSHLQHIRIPADDARALARAARRRDLAGERSRIHSVREALDRALDEAKARNDDQIVLLTDDRDHALELLGTARA
jgi:hypothetical protein